MFRDILRGLTMLAVMLCPLLAAAQQAGVVAGSPVMPAAETGTDSSAGPQKNPSDNATGSIPVGAEITMQNWAQYQQFMPDGMVALFQGRYYWKMPADVAMQVGPTIINQLPKAYLEATEKYASQVKIVELPDGGLTLTGYQGGIPFPHPAQPHKGWKVLSNVWYRYMPHLFVDTYGTGCMQDSYASINCTADEIVARQLSYNTDPGVPSQIPGAGDKFYTEWIMTLEPENQRYTASLVISYTDPSKPQDIFVFIPALRRSQHVSASARCTPYPGTDATSDDYRFGFNASLAEMKAKCRKEKNARAGRCEFSAIKTARWI